MCLLLFSLNKCKSHLEINLNLQIGAKQRKSHTLCEFGTRSISCPTLTVATFPSLTEALKIAKSLVKTFSADIAIVALLVQGFLYRTHIKCLTFAASPLYCNICFFLSKINNQCSNYCLVVI